jgi:peptidoglycan/LPS O-acetylase OafA/YrhL
LPALTGLRGVAALWVLFFHLPGFTQLPFIKYGHLGVGCFFILSGFILAHVYSGYFVRFSTRKYFRFLYVRLARIYPLHLATLALMAIIVVAVPGFTEMWSTAEVEARFSPRSFVECAALVQNWGYFYAPACNAPSWSLSAEWAAYLTFPLIVAATNLIRLNVLALAISAALLGGMHEYRIWHGWSDMLRLFCEFPCGCLLYKAWSGGLRIPDKLASILAVLLVAAPVLSERLDWLVPFGFSIIILLGASGRGLVAKPLSTKIAVAIGEISFSLYMIHWIIIMISEWAKRRFGLSNHIYALSTAVAAMSIAMSFLSLRYFERPVREWLKSRVERAPATPGISAVDVPSGNPTPA